MWEQWSGHFNLRDPSWRFVPCLVTLCSNTQLPYQDDKDYSTSIPSLPLVSVHLPPFMLSLYLSLFITYGCVVKTRAQRSVHFGGHKAQAYHSITQNPLCPDLMMNSVGRTHNQSMFVIAYNHGVYFTERIKHTNNLRPDFYYRAKKASFDVVLKNEIGGNQWHKQGNTSAELKQNLMSCEIMFSSTSAPSKWGGEGKWSVNKLPKLEKTPLYHCVKREVCQVVTGIYRKMISLVGKA